MELIWVATPLYKISSPFYPSISNYAQLDFATITCATIYDGTENCDNITFLPRHVCIHVCIQSYVVYPLFKFIYLYWIQRKPNWFPKGKCPLSVGHCRVCIGVDTWEFRLNTTWLTRRDPWGTVMGCRSLVVGHGLSQVRPRDHRPCEIGHGSWRSLASLDPFWPYPTLRSQGLDQLSTSFLYFPSSLPACYISPAQYQRAIFPQLSIRACYILCILKSQVQSKLS